MIGESDVDPYATLGVLTEGAFYKIIRHIPAERLADTVATMLEALEKRLAARGLHRGDS